MPPPHQGNYYPNLSRGVRVISPSSYVTSENEKFLDFDSNPMRFTEFQCGTNSSDTPPTDLQPALGKRQRAGLAKYEHRPV